MINIDETTNVHNSAVDGEGFITIYFNYEGLSYSIRVRNSDRPEEVKQQMINEILQNGA